MAAPSGWDSVRVCSGLFSLLSPHAQHGGGGQGAAGTRVHSPEGLSLILHLHALLKTEVVTNSVLYIPFLLFVKTQEQLGKGDEGLISDKF